MVFGSPLSNEPSVKQNLLNISCNYEVREGGEEKDKEGQYFHITGLGDGDHKWSYVV